MPASEDLGREGTMMYQTDVTLMPDEVRTAIDQLMVALEDNTDYLHAQVTFDDLRKDCEPTIHCIVEKLHTRMGPLFLVLLALGTYTGWF